MFAQDSDEPCVICAAALGRRPAVRLRKASLHTCIRCGTMHYRPPATVAEQSARHGSPEYGDHPYFRNRRARERRVRARCRNVFREIGRAVDVGSLRGQRILDVGCSTGEFLEAARDLFAVVPTGLDISPDAVAALRSKRIEARLGTLETAPADLGDLPVIVAIDLIEHVVDPIGFLRQTEARLGPGGVAYVETPNPRSTVYRLGSWLSRLTGGRPAPALERLFPPEHQFYFPAPALSEAAQQAGLEVARVSTRRLPLSDAAVSLPTKLVLAVTQAFDLLTGERTLVCLLVRRPRTESSATS